LICTNVQTASKLPDHELSSIRSSRSLALTEVSSVERMALQYKDPFEKEVEKLGTCFDVYDRRPGSEQGLTQIFYGPNRIKFKPVLHNLQALVSSCFEQSEKTPSTRKSQEAL
jgi:hypothetical protein